MFVTGSDMTILAAVVVERSISGVDSDGGGVVSSLSTACEDVVTVVFGDVVALVDRCPCDKESGEEEEPDVGRRGSFLMS